MTTSIKEYGLAKIDVQDTLNRLTEKSKSELTIAVRNLIIDELNNPKDTIQSDISLRNWLRMRKKHCLNTELASTIIFGKICDFVYNNIESRELKGKTLSLANLRIDIKTKETREQDNKSIGNADVDTKANSKVGNEIDVTWTDLLNSKYKPQISFSEGDIPSILLKLFSTSHLEDDAHYDSKIIFQLGVVYYHLLAREYRDDFESLIEGRNYKWSSRINALEREGKISTVTKEILRGCLLPNSWEHRRINGTISPIARKYSILKFDDLIFKISSAVNELRKSIVVGRIDDNELGRNDLSCVELKIIKA